jgi:GTP-binding protein
MSGLIAIVGRPNVGKSALFNRIVGRRIAIVHNEPGVTRDRVTAEAEWHGRPFTLVDTGGIGLLRREKAADVIARAAFEQVQIAIDAAQVIILVVNIQEGLTPLDQEVAQRLHKANKPVLIAVNKADDGKSEDQADVFTRLGFEKLFPVSAIHGRGIDALMDTAIQYIPLPEKISTEGVPVVQTPAFKLAIVGKPNVGKSSIINALTQSERVIVSPIPGTTRDAVDVPFEVETDGVRQRYVLIDTAGMRKRRRVDDTVEFFSVQRSEESIARCDLVIMVLDAESGITEQDKKICDQIVENNKACLIVINKWDLVDDIAHRVQEEEITNRETKESRHKPNRPTTLSDFGKWVQERLFFLDYAPVIFSSAKTGFNLDRLLEAIRYIAAQLQQKIPTAILNRTLRDAIELRQPVSNAGLRLKFFYATQIRECPPSFLLFVNRKDLLSPVYEKYLASSLRAAFGYEGCAIVLMPRERPKTIESVRGGKQTSKTSKPEADAPEKRPPFRPNRPFRPRIAGTRKIKARRLSKRHKP